MVTFWGWWVLKKWLNLAIEVSWLSLKEPECDFISFVCGRFGRLNSPLVGDLIGDNFRTQRKLFFATDKRRFLPPRASISACTTRPVAGKVRLEGIRSIGTRGYPQKASVKYVENAAMPSDNVCP